MEQILVVAPLRKAGGGLIRKLIGEVAKEAPELARGAASARRAVVNIGLDIPGGGRLSPDDALSVLERIGAKPVRSFVAQSDTEPTLVVELARSLAPDEAHEVSAMLKQEAIAQVDETGNGDLFGPSADNWKPFNGDFFIGPDGNRLTQKIMEAGNPEAVPGGAESDPVMKRLDEIASGLKREDEQVELVDGEVRQKYAGGDLVRKLGSGLVDMLDFSGVGKPRTVKIPGTGEVAALPIKELDDAAESYMKKHGIPGTHRIDQYPEFDEDFARKIAAEYDRAPHAPNDPKVRKAYDALIDETLAQYKALEDSGLDVRFLKDGMADPYAKSPSMGYADMVNNGRLWVFPTDQGYGSLDDIADNPLLKKVGRVGDKADAVANDAFRVVHDAYGHFGPGNPFFRHKGEDRAWQHHGRMFTDDALPAMTAETRGQNSWLNFGPYGEKNRNALGADTIFADQKATIMPPWVYEKDLGRTPRFADGGPVWSEDDADIATYEAMRDEVRRQSPDVQSMTHLGSKPTRDVTVDMPLFGGEYNFGPEPYDTADDKAAILQTAYDLKTVPAYFTPAAPAAAAWDVAEAFATGDPLTATLAVAGGIPGKAYKAAWNAVKPYAGKAVAGGSALAAATTAGSEDADAGVFGRLGKWGSSKAGREAMFDAMHMDAAGKMTPGEIRDATGWFKDTDGHWKYWRPSQGGFIWNTQGRKLGDVLNDPHLYTEYPEFADMTFRRKNNEGAHYDPDRNEIVLGDISKPGYHEPESGGPWGVILHETYHGKADKEGWPQGTSVLGGQEKSTLDMMRFLNSRKGTPEFEVGKDINTALSKGSAMRFGRYEAEVGEALARREQLMREMPEELLRGLTPNDQRYLDMPMDTLFHPGEIATPDKYRSLLQFLEDKAVAADKKAAQGDVYFTDKPPKRGKKK